MSAPSRTACLFLPGSGPLEAGVQEKLLEIASSFSPLVEDGRSVAEEPETGLGVVRLETRGLGRLHASPRALLEAMLDAAGAAGLPHVTVALADTPATAAVLSRAVWAHAESLSSASVRRAGGPARSGPPLWLSPPGEDRRSLASMPLHLLSAPEAPPLCPDSIEQLGLLAVRTAGAFAALPASSVEKRFGLTGLRLHRLARGEEHRPLSPWLPDPLFRKEADLETPLESLGALESVLSDLLEEFFAELSAKKRGLARLEVSYQAERGRKSRREIEIVDPLAGPETWLRLLRLDLESRPLEDPVIRIELLASCTISRESKTRGLFSAVPERGGSCRQPSSNSEHHPAQAGNGYSRPGKTEAGLEMKDASAVLAGAVARIRSRLGEKGVGVPALDDRHRPEAAFHIEPSLPGSSRSSRRRESACAAAPRPAKSPPLALRLVSPRPVQVETDEDGRPSLIDGSPALSAGPFPASGEWWASPYDRTYYEVATREALLWIYRDGIDTAWYIHGIFD
ncbi:MAG: hypothetical protein ACOCVR_03450 [Myxococcota bacterium]